MSIHTDPDDALRAHEDAWRRFKAAEQESDVRATIIAEDAARGWLPTSTTLDRFVVARAAAFEARADWADASAACRRLLDRRILGGAA